MDVMHTNPFKKLFFQNQKLVLVSNSVEWPRSRLLPMGGAPEERRPQLISQCWHPPCRDSNTGQGCALRDRNEHPETPGLQPEEAPEGQRRAQARDSVAALSITSGREDDFLFVVGLTQCVCVCSRSGFWPEMKPNRILPSWFLPPAPRRPCSPENGGRAPNLKGGRGIVCVEAGSAMQRVFHQPRHGL